MISYELKTVTLTTATIASLNKISATALQLYCEYLVIAQQQNTSSVYAKNSYLAQRLGISEKTIARTKAQLVRAGLISYKSEKYGKTYTQIHYMVKDGVSSQSLQLQEPVEKKEAEDKASSSCDDTWSNDTWYDSYMVTFIHGMICPSNTIDINNSIDISNAIDINYTISDLQSDDDDGKAQLETNTNTQHTESKKSDDSVLAHPPKKAATPLKDISWEEYQRKNNITYKKPGVKPVREYLKVIDGYNELFGRKITLTNTNQRLITQGFSNGHSAEDIVRAFANRRTQKWALQYWEEHSFDSMFYQVKRNGEPVDWIDVFAGERRNAELESAEEHLQDLAYKFKELHGLTNERVNYFAKTKHPDWTASELRGFGGDFEKTTESIKELYNAYQKYINLKQA